MSNSALFSNVTMSPMGVREVEPKDVHQHLDKVKIIDVRQPHEYVGELGHIKTAELIPMDKISECLESFQKNQPLVIVCRSGARSERVAAFMQTQGFNNVFNLAGGMIYWRECGLEAER